MHSVVRRRINTARQLTRRMRKEGVVGPTNSPQLDVPSMFELAKELSGRLSRTRTRTKYRELS